VGDHDNNAATADVAMGFDPVGTFEEENPHAGFTGSLDGQGYTINSLYINRPSEDYVGLFGCIADGGNIHGVDIEEADIKGNSRVGVFVGQTFAYSEESEVIIEGCSVSGRVLGVSNFVGGFCGVNYSENGISRILDSYASAIVTGYFDVGGFCGLNFSYYNSATVSGSYSSGSVSGYSYVGGFCGVNFTNYGIARLSDSYAIGDVTGHDKFIGGFCSKNYLLDSSVALSITERCYSIGYVSGNNNVSGFCVSQDTSNSSTIIFCYWDTQTSGTTQSDGGTGKSTAEMMMQSTFVDWDFNDVWCMAEGQTYPQLQYFVDCDNLVSVPEISNETEISIYPNPADNEIRISSGEYINTVKIINLLGNVVKEITPEKQVLIQIPVDDLPTGYYIVNVYLNKEQIAHPIIIE